ncbi:hypothetical protein Q8F55_004477 [Vanrija albida]|uniref:Pirin N-terminal domain-containing protein n=1 Tax=Vanrija albida TaxID=181172 RepID=A0ABR3Q733_9TREE
MSSISKALGKVVDLGAPWRGIGPFIFAVFHRDDYPAGNAQLGPSTGTAGHALGSDFGHPSGWNMYHGKTVPGFPAHPHKGFETISIVDKGLIDHHDSAGAGARYGPGDVQWVTAGNGISHSEMFPLVHEDKPNPMEMYQIWINLPAAKKGSPPDFVMMWSDSIPVVTKESTHGTAKVRVIAGSFDGVTAPKPPKNSYASDPEGDVAIYLVDLDARASVKLPVANNPKTKRLLYVHDRDRSDAAKVNVSGTWVDNKAGFEQSAESITTERLTLTAGNAPVKVLVLQGVDIDEPVAKHGPFVMNTQKEIQEAFDLYRKTEFGGWPWDSSAPVYPADKPRFAKFPDGHYEYPEGEPAAAKA